MNIITPEQLSALRELAVSLRQQIERGDDVSQSQQRSFTTICFALPDLVDMIGSLEGRCGLYAQAIASNYQAYQGENTTLRQQLEKSERGECHWHLEDKDWGDWLSDCGLEWYLEAENPTENEMRYCPKCGKVLVVD